MAVASRRGVEYIQRQVANSQLAILVLGGVILEVLLSFGSLPSPFTFYGSVTIIPFPRDALSIFGEFVMPLGYCAVVSSLVNPKRIASPVLVQIGAVLITSAIVLNGTYAVSRNTAVPLSTAVGFATISLGVSAMLWAVVGFIQTFFVSWVVGLNLLGLNEKRYGLNAPTSAIDAALKDNQSYLLRKLDELEERQVEEVRVFKAAIPTGEVIVIAMREDLTQTDSTILATVAYETNATSMLDTRRAQDTRDAIVFELFGAISQARLGTSIITLGKDDTDIAATIALLEATKPSESKVETARVFLKELPRYFQFALASTLSLMVVLAGLAYLAIAKFDLVDVLALLFVALVVELGVAIRDERGKTKGRRRTSP